ncbi:hypothetical protein DV711_03370 [Motiliproteus coralliicola]|uniref:Uncharacterized protein n=2 Tax=Motiliproteus coralliicola TaxID=2283196 RepID=A0A369WSU1_9GAMM|nr:hypothetical protein DV711_03370 [Motiliproteus coralliicola]
MVVSRQRQQASVTGSQLVCIGLVVVILDLLFFLANNSEPFTRIHWFLSGLGLAMMLTGVLSEQRTLSRLTNS